MNPNPSPLSEPERLALKAMFAQQAATWGPLSYASDGDEVRLIAASINAALLLPGWCQCQDPTGPETLEVYFQRDDGSHGFMCYHCRKLTQTS